MRGTRKSLLSLTQCRALATALAVAACGSALGDASWTGQPYSATVAEHLTGTGQARSGSLAISLSHDVPCTVAVSVDRAGDEVLRLDGDWLATSYKLNGAALENGDAEWVDSTTFLSRSYAVPGTGPADELTLWVRAAAAPDRANEAGTYTAAIVLTASW
jgi:hypothetical protein